MLDTYIAKCIIGAQVGSDAGKGIYQISEADPWAADNGYDAKDYYIRKAIKAVIRNKESGVYFYVTPDYEGVAEYIVYFNYKIDGVRKQISFHSFDKRLERYVTSKSKKCKTSWTYKRDSRDNCVELYNYITAYENHVW